MQLPVRTMKESVFWGEKLENHFLESKLSISASARQVQTAKNWLILRLTQKFIYVLASTELDLFTDTTHLMIFAFVPKL